MPDQSSEKDLRLAVLIDADNASRTAMKDVMAEVAVYGTPTIKRIYGDWTSPNMSTWKSILLETAITPIQQYSYTTGKNATDSAMIIDAMDILYSGNCDGFVLVSSDSDYWGLISAMPEVRFFVMVESEKCSPTIKNALINAGISYCYIDDFCTGNSNDIKVAAVLREVRQKLDQAFHLNVRDILDEACRATRADMTTAEKNQFYDKYIKTMHVDISPNGEATIVLGK